MHTDIHAEIQKVQKLSKLLRAGCTYLMAMLALVLVFVSFLMFFSKDKTSYNFGAFRVAASQMTPAIEVWSLLLLATMFAVLGSGLLHFRALFANFVAGGIYTSENVRHVRHLGRLALLFALWQLAQPMVDFVLLLSGVFDKSMAIPGSAALQLAEGGLTLQLQGGVKTLPPFMMAGLIILASWIMEVGRRTSEEADQLRHEVELVV